MFVPRSQFFTFEYQDREKAKLMELDPTSPPRSSVEDSGADSSSAAFHAAGDLQFSANKVATWPSGGAPTSSNGKRVVGHANRAPQESKPGSGVPAANVLSGAAAIASLESGPPLQALTRSARVLRWLLFRKLNSVKQGQLVVIDHDGENAFGREGFEPNRTEAVPGLTSDMTNDALAQSTVYLRIHNPDAYRKIVLSGDLGFADSLIDGDWTTNDLTALLRFFIRNMQVADQVNDLQTNVRAKFSRIKHWLQRNTTSNARRNIKAHYDLSNEFFSLWLDPTMSYSCGVFPELNDGAVPPSLEADSAKAQTAGALRSLRSPESMEVASREKLDRICQKLDLKADDHVVEIGCGWGGFAIHAAQHYGCRVTGITISQEQLEFARQRVSDLGLQDRIDLHLQDYRLMEGKFDKLVSIEMIEAVGHQFFDQYFRKCCQLLKPQGRMVLQGITIGDHRFDRYLKTVDFIREYIFPGGCLASVSAMMKSVARSTDFRLIHLEDIGLHYAETLRRWRLAFHQHLPKVNALGFDQKFVRMWDYYLAYCEAAFDEGYVGTVQMVFDRPQSVLDAVLISNKISRRCHQVSVAPVP